MRDTRKRRKGGRMEGWQERRRRIKNTRKKNKEGKDDERRELNKKLNHNRERKTGRERGKGEAGRIGKKSVREVGEQGRETKS